MKRREWALILTVVACLIYVQQTIVETAFMYYMTQQTAGDAPTPAPYGPSIAHCFHEGEQRDLWDCIRHVDQSTDP